MKEDHEKKVSEKESDRKDLLVGMFKNRDDAELAFDDLNQLGYTNEEINLLMSEETRTRYYNNKEKEKYDTELGNKAAEGAGTGSLVGGALGAIAGAVAAIGTTLLIPGLGVVIAGPIVAGLAGAGAGSLAGGLIGALVGLGIPEDKAHLYEKGIKEGNIVIGVYPRNDEERKIISNKWRNRNVLNIH
ncbi:hypothetical protein [Litoribacter populi]|uniref:hypothetical protein n=1 Tax=Litoribacter populi TaxID=2598460 RepID=UPI001180642B|nr:hypothetical protein [Litoribacter populi]